MTDVSDTSHSDEDHPVDVTAVRDAVLAEHGDLVETALSAADDVDDRFDGPYTDGQALATSLSRALNEAGIHEHFPTVITTAIEATDLSLAADPVAAPPYVAITSRGPVLRGPTSDGRLVVTILAFAVERDPRQYVRATDDVADALVVEFTD